MNARSASPTVAPAAPLAVASTASALVDPRLAFLARAHARFILVEAGEMSLDEALDGLLDVLIVGPQQ
jgi:hypothetical protein